MILYHVNETVVGKNMIIIFSNYSIIRTYTNRYKNSNDTYFYVHIIFLRFHLPSFIDAINFSSDAVLSLCNHFIIISLLHRTESFEQSFSTSSSWLWSIFSKIPISFQSTAWGKMICVKEPCIRCPVPSNTQW